MEKMTETKQKTPTMDAMRKRALAAVCQCMEAIGNRPYLEKDYAGRLEYARGVLCRAARVDRDSFNRIGRERLRGLTAMFNKMSRDMDGVIKETYKIIGE